MTYLGDHSALLRRHAMKTFRKQPLKNISEKSVNFDDP